MRNQTFQVKPLRQQTVVITGATSGIGLATAHLAARKGARVILSGRASADVTKCVSKIRAAGGEVTGCVADVTNIEDLVKLRDLARDTYGSLDTWINNAGTGIYGYLMDGNVLEERTLFETNFWSLVNGSRIAVQAMKENGGTLINLGSEVSVVSVPLQGMYSATKRAIKAFTEALRIELHEQKLPIAVCLVRPAGVDTQFPDHAVNHLRDGEPALPAPVYDINVGAEAIVSGIENPQRDIYVGGASRLFGVIDTLFPNLTDKMSESMMKQIKAGTKRPHTEENEAASSCATK